jgi:secreted Zn-dependent insulinase-like peptidase
MVSHQRVALCMCVCVQAGALEREVQAVDSEFKGVLQSDHSRLAQLMCHTVSERMR